MMTIKNNLNYGREGVRRDDKSRRRIIIIIIRIILYLRRVFYVRLIMFKLYKNYATAVDLTKSCTNPYLPNPLSGFP